MKHTIISSVSSLKKLQGVSVIVGLVLGVLIAYALMCLTMSMHSNGKEGWGHTRKSSDSMHTMDHGANATNPYMMVKVTSEKQFVREMKLHHDAAVLMSQQLLLLKNIRPEVSELAKNIVTNQMTEIKMMNGWIAEFGY